MDLAQFFDTMPHSEVVELLAKRIKDRKFLSLIARMLKAGIQTPEGRVEGKQGESSRLNRITNNCEYTIRACAGSMVYSDSNPSIAEATVPSSAMPTIA